jgi:hypothetical protein
MLSNTMQHGVDERTNAPVAVAIEHADKLGGNVEAQRHAIEGNYEGDSVRSVVPR